jgi:hypothetical protein
MKSATGHLDKAAEWPPLAGDLVSFTTAAGVQHGVLKEVRWGLVWRDFLLDDGRVIAEQKIVGAPQPPVWREPKDVSQEEQQAWEERLVVMSQSGLDPHDRESPFWGALTQYLAFTYLKFQRVAGAADR